MDCSPPGSSVHGIFQARILEWVAIFSSRGSSQPRVRTLSIQEKWVQSLGKEDHLEGPLEKEMATHSSILARKIPWTEGPGGLQSMGLLRVRHD